MAVALASQNEPVDLNGISNIADGINHAVPTNGELKKSIGWLINKELIVKQGRKYELTSKGKTEYKIASEKTDKLLAIWKNLEIKLKDYL